MYRGPFLRSFGGSFVDKCVFVESNGASGGLITCWSFRVFICHEVIMRRFSITVLLTHVMSKAKFYVMCMDCLCGKVRRSSIQRWCN